MTWGLALGYDPRAKNHHSNHEFETTTGRRCLLVNQHFPCERTMPLSPEELGQLLDQYWGTLVAWVGWEHSFAEDVVQAAFIKLATQSPPPTDCPAWLFQVSRRLALNELKATQRRRKREQISIDLRQTDSSSSTMDSEALRATLEQLSPQDRQIVVARIWGALTFDQIAAAVELPKATVWRMYQSAIEQLRSHYEQGLSR